MSPTPAALVSRARGLGTHLLPRATLRGLLEAPDLDALARRLEEHAVPATPRPVQAAALELTARRWAAAELARLARWLPEEAAITEALFGEEDVRSVRAMLRGATAGVPADRRLAGLIPTPRLPERLLGELARQPSAREIAALLVTWEHPLGSALLDATAGIEPDLTAVERALLQGGARALHAASRRHGSGLRGWARETIDVANARLAIGLATRDEDAAPEAALLDGGTVPRAAFAPVIAADSPADAAMRAAALLPPGPLAAALRAHAGRLAQLDDALLAARIETLRRRVRLDPLAPDAVLLYALRLRAQVILLQLATWRLSLGMPLPDAGPLLEAAA